jgi:hypothetical protein
MTLFSAPRPILTVPSAKEKRLPNWLELGA